MINNSQQKVIITNNHVINCKEDAACAVARFHYEGDLPGADVKLYPENLFFTNPVCTIFYFKKMFSFLKTLFNLF